MVAKIIMIAVMCLFIAAMQQSDDPGIPPGGDPDVDEVPFDQYVWLLLATGGIYGCYKIIDIVKTECESETS